VRLAAVGPRSVDDTSADYVKHPAEVAVRGGRTGAVGPRGPALDEGLARTP